MYFGFTSFTTEHVNEQHKLINKIFFFLQIVFEEKDYGEGMQKAVFAFSCGGPLSELWRDFPTGMVTQEKYTRSKKMLELTFRLSYNEVIAAKSEEELIQITERGFLKTYDAVKALNIKDFDVDRFYKDLKELLASRAWIKEPEKYKPKPFVYKHQEEEGSVKEADKMPEEEFWQQIQQSIDASNGDVEKQIEILIDLLSDKTEKEIIGFEYRLRELLKKSYHHNTTALLKIIQGSVTDDTLLYFRCRLILYGKEIFETAVFKPIKLTHKIYTNDAAELLLSAADKAFIKKFGKDTDKELPRDVAGSFLNYDEADYKLLGIPWNKKNFEKLYAPLLKLYEA